MSSRKFYRVVFCAVQCFYFSIKHHLSLISKISSNSNNVWFKLTAKIFHFEKIKSCCSPQYSLIRKMQSLGNDARREEKYFSRFRSCQTFINWFKSICFVIFCWIGNWVLSKCYQIPKEYTQIDLRRHKRLL